MITFFFHSQSSLKINIFTAYRVASASNEFSLDELFDELEEEEEEEESSSRFTKRSPKSQMFEDDYKRSDSSMNRGTSKPWGKGSTNFKRPEGSDITLLINNNIYMYIYIIFKTNSFEYLNQATLFVGNLPYAVDEDILKREFEKALGQDTVAGVRIAIEKDTNRKRGFGYVDFYSREMAENAIARMNGKAVLGRNINVDDATRDRRSSFSGRENRF
jgi:nucleolin